MKLVIANSHNLINIKSLWLAKKIIAEPKQKNGGKTKLEKKRVKLEAAKNKIGHQEKNQSPKKNDR